MVGYLMVLPSTVLIFIFGLFPVGFAVFVSVHNWRLKRGDFLGIDNYTRAIDDLAYILLYGISLLALVGAVLLVRRVFQEAKLRDEQVWPQLIPGLLNGAAAIALIRWLVLALPEVLDIADKIVGLEKTQALFLRLLREAFATPHVAAAGWQFLALLLAALIISAYLIARAKTPSAPSYQFRFSLAWFAAAAAAILGAFTFQEMVRAIQAAQAAGEGTATWPNIIMISTGVLLLVGAWVLWRQGTNADQDREFIWKLGAASVLLVAAWVLIAELPTIIAAGDADMWQGLKVTIYYSVGTVPFQLAFAMFLAILLFQKLRGSELFRMLFFLPYVTPVVASAAVFRQLFSNRQQAPVNQILLSLGLDHQQWLREPQGIFSMLAETVGTDIPAWAAGPSLALLVVIIYNIWVYVGYDTVIYLAGLGNIETELIEAAEIDGASSWQVFRFIIFPLLSPTTYFLSLIAIIGTFKAFTHIWVMRLGSALGTTDTFSVVIFAEFFEKLRYGYASALAFVLFAVILALTLLNNRIQGSRVFYG